MTEYEHQTLSAPLSKLNEKFEVPAYDKHQTLSAPLSKL